MTSLPRLHKLVARFHALRLCRHSGPDTPATRVSAGPERLPQLLQEGFILVTRPLTVKSLSSQRAMTSSRRDARTFGCSSLASSAVLAPYEASRLELPSVQEVSSRSPLREAASKALGGGVAGGVAMCAHVASLMVRPGTR